MKVALCCIGRLENQYAVEYVDYYKSIGFDKIFIYDNNYDGEEHFEDVLQQYIDDGFVTVIDYRNKMLCQMKAYEECYKKHNNDYDWIAFFDFDEYITLKNDKNIKDYLSDKIFDNFECIHINWMYYGDNNNVRYENKPLTERFTKPTDYNLKVTYDFPENYHIKSIIKRGINNFKWLKNTHSPGIDLKCCNAIGETCSDTAFSPYNFDRCYLRHYATKTIEEWIKYKMKRGGADMTYENFRKLVKPDRFFVVNERTKEKEDLMNELMKEIDAGLTPSGNTKDNLDLFIGAYKRFEPPVTNKAYKVIIGNHDVDFDGFPLDVIKCGNKDDVLDDKFYSEQYMLRNLVEDNYPFKEYVGFCHYRKYFSFMDEIPNLDEIFKDYDAIVPRVVKSKKSIREQYAACHNVEDLNLVEKIIKEKFPEYSNACNVFIDNNILVPYEMYIMKRDDFIDCIKFINAVLDEYLKEIGTTDIVKHIEDNKDKYLKRFPPNDTVEYQYRIGGYLSERITNIFMIHRFKKMKTYPVKITEAKYDNEKKIKPRLVKVGSNGFLIDTNDGIIRLYRGTEMVYKGTFDTLVDNIKGSKKREAENE